MGTLKEYISKYRNIVNSAVVQCSTDPLWNKEMLYLYSTSSDKVNSEIEGETANLQVQFTYPENIEWDYCRYNNFYKKNVSELHAFKLIFDKFDTVSSIGQRNILGTYIKDVNATVFVRDTDGDITTKTYVDTLSGVFKSYDFDYKCSINYTGTNEKLIGKKIFFIDEEFISTTDPQADPNENNDEPDYRVNFTSNHCHVHLFTDQQCKIT